jgi:hypothetical protein
MFHVHVSVQSLGYQHTLSSKNWIVKQAVSALLSQHQTLWALGISTAQARGLTPMRLCNNNPTTSMYKQDRSKNDSLARVVNWMQLTGGYCMGRQVSTFVDVMYTDGTCMHVEEIQVMPAVLKQ